MPLPVFLRHIPDYNDPRLDKTVAGLLHAAGLRPSPGTRVLVKPNLVTPKNPSLACTRPEIVRAACLYLLDCRAVVTVGDSPAFGTCRIAARTAGLTKALADLPVVIADFSRARRIPLSFGGKAAVAVQALDADTILNIPRLKAHNQMGVTLAVKNLFGCVTGFRKSLAHQLYGEKENKFERLIIEVMTCLPETFSLLDGITAMHKSGPTGGEPYDLGMLAAAKSAPALDTAVYATLGLDDAAIPLWRELRRTGVPGADPDDIGYPLLRPEHFPGQGFIAPQTLSDVAFHPARFVRGRIKSLLTRFG